MIFGLNIPKSAMPLALGLAALAFAVIQPPEAFGDGRMAVILCATFAFLGALGEGQIPSRYVWAGLAGLGFLVTHALAVSVDIYRSLEFTTILWAYFCLAGVLFYSRENPSKPIAVTMIALAAILSVYGIYQYFWGFDTLERLIVYSGSTEIVKAPALARVSERRVTSTMALPGTLWGVLTIALPFHLALVSKRRSMNAALAAAAAILLTAGFLTRSFGLLVGLAAAIACWLLSGRARGAWHRIIPFLVASSVAGVLFYSARRAAIEAQDPMALRFLNWISAWSIFSSHPLGTGLNTFGVVYTQHMLPNANETQFAHNTLLQFLSELGYPALIAVVAVAVFLARRPGNDDENVFRRAAACGMAAWLAHNLIDIDVYFPSVGVTGLVAAVLWLRTSRTGNPGEPSEAATNRGALYAAVAASVPLLVFSALALVSTELQHRAQAEYAERKGLVAIETLKLAKQFMPLNSSLYHDAGQIELDLSQRTHDTKHLEAATENFQRAIGLSPQKVGPHIGYGLCLASANRLRDALDEIGVAKRLYPRGREASAVAKLLTDRLRGATGTGISETAP